MLAVLRREIGKVSAGVRRSNPFPGRGPISTPAGALSERALIEAIQEGDERKAGQLYSSLLPAVQATLLRVLGAPDLDHRALVQRSVEQVVVELARHPNPGVCRLEVWATICATRVALDLLRTRTRARDVEISWGDALARARGTDIQASAAPGSAVERLRWLLAELPPHQAEAVVLCDVMSQPAADVAAALGVGVEHVRRLLSAGHERLARQVLSTAS